MAFQAAHLEENVDTIVRRMRSELEVLLRQREETMRRIGTVKKTLAGLVSLFGDDVLDDEMLTLLNGGGSPRRHGLTRECRLVLMNAPQPLAAREVCDRVTQRLPFVSSHKDPMASIVTVLGRLVRYGEARKVNGQGGLCKWTWISEPSSDQFEARV